MYTSFRGATSIHPSSLMMWIIPIFRSFLGPCPQPTAMSGSSSFSLLQHGIWGSFMPKRDLIAAPASNPRIILTAPSENFQFSSIILINMHELLLFAKHIFSLFMQGWQKIGWDCLHIDEIYDRLFCHPYHVSWGEQEKNPGEKLHPESLWQMMRASCMYSWGHYLDVNSFASGIDYANGARVLNANDMGQEGPSQSHNMASEILLCARLTVSAIQFPELCFICISIADFHRMFLLGSCVKNCLLYKVDSEDFQPPVLSLALAVFLIPTAVFECDFGGLLIS